MGLLKLIALLFPGVNAWATEKSFSDRGTSSSVSHLDAPQVIPYKANA